MKRFMVWVIAFVFLFTTSAIAAEVKKEAAAPAAKAEPAKAEAAKADPAKADAERPSERRQR